MRGNAGNGQNDRSGVLDSSPSHQRPEMEIVKNQTWSPVSLSKKPIEDINRLCKKESCSSGYDYCIIFV